MPILYTHLIGHLNEQIVASSHNDVNVFFHSVYFTMYKYNIRSILLQRVEEYVQRGVVYTNLITEHNNTYK